MYCLLVGIMMISKNKVDLKRKTPNTAFFDQKQELTFVHGVGNTLKTPRICLLCSWHQDVGCSA